MLAPRARHHEVPGPPRLTLRRGGVKRGPPLPAPPATFHMPRSCLAVRTPRALRSTRRREPAPSSYSAVLDTEREVDALKEELRGWRCSCAKVFQASRQEWVEERLTQLQDVLERNPDRSGLILRNFLGPLRLDPTRGDIGRPYYTARTSLNPLGPTGPADRRRSTGKWLYIGGSPLR